MNGSKLFRILKNLYDAGVSAGRGKHVLNDPIQYAAKAIKELAREDS
jgi:hypothetical protein